MQAGMKVETNYQTDSLIICLERYEGALDAHRNRRIISELQTNG